MNSGIERLVELDLYGVYPAEFQGLEKSFLGMSNVPKVKIFRSIYDTTSSYYGFVLPSTHSSQKLRAEANRIRDQLIRDGSSLGRIPVDIFKHPISGDPRGPYIVTPHPKFGANKANTDSSAEEALSVLTCRSVFYARYTRTNDDRGYPCLTVYNPDGSPKFAVLHYTHHGHSAKDNSDLPMIRAESSIGGELIRQLKLDDCLIVRKQAHSIYSGTLIVEPVINFLESDDALSPAGRKLVTNFEGYDKGDRIFDLPIIEVTKNYLGSDLIGVGYIKRPESEGRNFYYKKTLVLGAERDVGKYIEEARILKNGKEVILAHKVR